MLLLTAKAKKKHTLHLHSKRGDLSQSKPIEMVVEIKRFLNAVTGK